MQITKYLRTKEKETLKKTLKHKVATKKNPKQKISRTKINDQSKRMKSKISRKDNGKAIGKKNSYILLLFLAELFMVFKCQLNC